MPSWSHVALLGAALLLLVQAESLGPLTRSKRLTAFGKTPTETETKIPRGKECKDDKDCTALEYTTCKTDTDHRKRCLCHDLQAPFNGECASKKRELHQECSSDKECIDGAECIVNTTITHGKRCYCKPDYEEDDINKKCNNGDIITAGLTLIIISTLACFVFPSHN